MGERLVTLHQLASRWGVPYFVVLDLAREGELESVRHGRERLYPESALAFYLESKGLAADEYSDAD